MSKRAYLKIISVAAIFILYISLQAPAAENRGMEDIFKSANELYKKGDYETASAKYKEILDSGYASGNIYYNIANSCFKAGHLGEAILNYERAKRLIPRDSDLKSSYDYAMQSVEKTARADFKILPLKLLDDLADNLTIDEAAIFLSTVFLIFAVALLARLYLGLVKRYYGALMIILIAFFILGALVFIVDLRNINTQAVIMVKSAEAKFEPFDRATTHFTLYEGTKANVVASKDSWHKVRRSDGRTGWLKRTDLEII